MNSIYITGIAGFIGRHAAKAFAEAGWLVEGCDKRWGTPVEHLSQKRVAQPEVVLHCAANIESLDKRQSGPLSQFDDISLDRCLLDWLQSRRPSRLIWMSSCVAGLQDPLDPYSTVKAAGESMALHFGRTVGIPVYVLRPFSGYGEDQSVNYPFAAICDRALRCENPLVVWSDSVRDFIHVDDIVRYILAAAEHKLPVGVPIPVGTGRPTSFSQLAEMFANCVGYSPRIAIDHSKPPGHLYRVLQEEPFFKPSISLEKGIQRAIAVRSHALNEV